ncbi:MAG: hypothetical protein E6G92_09335 [Alphaproteobacteria bacterium]|nr:MAG: hypothetical protein E6G92_09335 [Alphaproteobacteria bacterium]
MSQTPREKVAMADGIGLFFGALLGANLGTLGGLSLYDYGVVIFVLACTVIALRMFSTSERRGYAYTLLATYAGVIAYVLYYQRPAGLAPADAARMMVTLGIWLAAVVFVELHPTRDLEGDQA